MRKDVTDDVDEKEAEKQNAKCKRTNCRKMKRRKNTDVARTSTYMFTYVLCCSNEHTDTYKKEYECKRSECVAGEECKEKNENKRTKPARGKIN